MQKKESGTAELRIGATALGTIRDHLQSGYPEEACGGLLGRMTPEGRAAVTLAVPAENTRTDERNRRYLIGPDDVLSMEKRAKAAGLEVVGYYHSHPDAPAEPSSFDREHAWPWYVYLIVSVRKGDAADLRAWRLQEDRSSFEAVTLIS